MKKLIAILAGSSAVLTLPACADKVDESESTNFSVTASDDSCVVGGADTATGTSTFNVSNQGAKTTEFYVYTSGGRVVGEVENIGPGATRKLIVHITDPGAYTLTCKPGMVGDGISQPLNVTGEAVEATQDEVLAQAVDGYISYVRSQTTALQGYVDEFVAAIEAGDVDSAKEQFAIARTPYERIEPVAESFPDDLDPRIDFREADIQEGDTWTGFHTIEKDLWEKGGDHRGDEAGGGTAQEGYRRVGRRRCRRGLHPHTGPDCLRCAGAARRDCYFQNHRRGRHLLPYRSL